MNITDELRERIDDEALLLSTRRELWNIADRIDAEHDKAIRELNNLADAIADSCVQLPKDANGEYIHIGDVMENIYGSVDVVEGILSDRYLVLRDNDWLTIRADLSHHHHEPTVEDVLDEFASAYDRIGGEDEEHQKYLDLIAEYAAKLQLKEPDE